MVQTYSFQDFYDQGTYRGRSLECIAIAALLCELLLSSDSRLICPVSVW